MIIWASKFWSSRSGCQKCSCAVLSTLVLLSRGGASRLDNVREWSRQGMELDEFGHSVWISQPIATRGAFQNIPKFWCWILVEDWILCDRVDAMAATSLLIWPRFWSFLYWNFYLKALCPRLKSLMAFDKNCAKTRRKAQVLLLCGFCLIYFGFKYFKSDSQLITVC